MIQVQPADASCGATIRGVDLSKPLDAATVAELRQIWLKHQVVAFADQDLSIEDLERFTLLIGPRGEDPYIAPIPGHKHVVEIKREANEQSKLFAENWHSDWSFLPIPPAGTALYGCEIPPVGGDTLFADQYAAWDTLPAALKSQVEGKLAIHSARRGYSPKGAYGEKDREAGRSMAIVYSDTAMRTRSHPIGRVHPETGRTALFVSGAYVIGIEGMPDNEADDLLNQLYDHMGQEQFVYRHRWSVGTLLLWDNRCLVHRATGGYEGHRRLLRRITISERTPQTASAH
ncbi:MAG: TauD/TfdA dioxygenase family protein [Burkholderiales bacterium]|jgi:taurine dioxygenase